MLTYAEAAREVAEQLDEEEELEITYAAVC